MRALLGEDAAPVYRNVHRVAEHFGLSRLTALNVATNVCGWSKDERLHVEESFEGAPPLDDNTWRMELLAAMPGDDELLTLASRAVAERRLLPAERDRFVREAEDLA